MNIKIIMKQIIEAIIYCHQINICHRDIKPGNFMLKDTSNIKSVKLILKNEFFIINVSL